MLLDLNAITPQTWLARTFKDFVLRTRNLRLSQASEIAANANALDGTRKEEFVVHFELFWFTVKAITGIIEDLLHAAWRLEALKKVGSEPPTMWEASGDAVAHTISLSDTLRLKIAVRVRPGLSAGC